MNITFFCFKRPLLCVCGRREISGLAKTHRKSGGAEAFTTTSQPKYDGLHMIHINSRQQLGLVRINSLVLQYWQSTQGLYLLGKCSSTCHSPCLSFLETDNFQQVLVRCQEFLFFSFFLSSVDSVILVNQTVLQSGKVLILSSSSSSPTPAPPGPFFAFFLFTQPEPPP